MGDYIYKRKVKSCSNLEKLDKEFLLDAAEFFHFFFFFFACFSVNVSS